MSFICSGYTLKGSVSYSVESARIDAFNSVSLTIDIKKYEKFFTDINFETNIKALKRNKKKYKGKRLTLYSDGSYTIRYNKKIDTSFLYDKQGKLYGITIDLGKGYPSKRITYDSKGILDSITLDKSKNEQYIFDTNKKLIAHWIGNNCYNEQGELVMTRE